MKSYDTAPPEIKKFITYLVAIKGRSQLTADEYFYDLRNFFRFLILKRNLIDNQTPFSEIEIDCVDLNFIKSVTTEDIYDFLLHMSRDRATQQNSSATEFGLENKSLARKISALRSFYRYLCEKAKVIDYNPTATIEPTKSKKTLPKFLTLDESISLLQCVEGPHKDRDFCILTLFLNCGMRVSELVSINLGDIGGETIHIMGKGGKERTVYLNSACKDAIEAYIPVRLPAKKAHEKALFISQMGNRINVQTVKWLVKKYLGEAGLASKKMSVHKLRHTAATLMYQNGVDVRVLQEVLGHENLNTTKIYTHVISEDLKNAADKNPLSGLKLGKNNKKESDQDDLATTAENQEIKDDEPIE